MSLHSPRNTVIQDADPSPALAAIRTSPLLRALPGPVLSRWLARMDEQTYAAGEVLAHEGDAALALWVLVEGQCERLQGGLKLDSLSAPALLGQESAGLGQSRFTLEARTPLRVWRVPGASIQAACTAVDGLQAQLTQDLFCSVGERNRGEPFDRVEPALNLSTRRPSIPPPVPGSEAQTKDSTGVTLKSVLGWAVAVVLPLVLYFAGERSGLSLEASLFMAILGMVVTLWVFSLVDDFIAPVVALVSILFVGLAPPAVVLSGFASPGFMTLLSVFALAAMLTGSGLTERLLLLMLLHLPNRPLWHQVTLLLYGLVLSLGTPSGNNRMALMLPAFQEVGTGLRLVERGPALTALFAATYGGSMLFSTALASSKSATISVMGFLPFHLQDYYAGLFWVGAAAVCTLGLLGLHLLAARWIFPIRSAASVSKVLLRDRLSLLGPMRLPEKVTFVGFAVFLLGSLSTSIHHVTPSAVAGVVLIGLLLTGVLTKANFQRSIDWPMIVFLVSTECLIKVMDYLGLSAQLAEVLRGNLQFIQGDVVRFIGVALLVVLIVRLFLPIPAGMLLSAVILMPVAQSDGINLWVAVFVIAMFSDLWFFRYQNSVYMIAVSAGSLALIDERSFMRHNMVMNLGRIAVVFASVPLWQWLGLA